MFNNKKFRNKIVTAQTNPEEMLSQNMPESSELPFSDIPRDTESLRKLAGELIKLEGGEFPTPEIIDRIVKKLLARTSNVHIPIIQKLLGMKSRPGAQVTQLLQYRKPEEIAAIRNFISTEILTSRLEQANSFNSILQIAKQYNPSFTLEMLCFIVQNGKPAISKNEEITSLLNTQQLNDIIKRINDLKQFIRMLKAEDRDWNQILAGLYETRKSVPISEEEKAQWLELIPEEMRIQWNLEQILRYFNYPLSDVPEKIRATRTVSKDESLYYYFFPEKDEMGNELVTDSDKENYKLRKLKESIENGYDNEQNLFSLLGLKAKKGRVRRGRPRKDTTTEPELLQTESTETEEQIEQETPTEPTNVSGKRILHYWRYLVKTGDVKSVLDPSSRLGAFRNDLRKAGLPYVAEMLGKAYTKPEDERYKEFDLKFLSEEEKNICDVLREDFYLDPIPFPVKIPCPVDNPTTTERFEIDFLLPADVLVGFIVKKQEVIDPNTGEVRTIRTVIPKIESQVIFVGEYFGIRYTMPGRKIDHMAGKPWVKPSGERPVYMVKQDIEVIDEKTGEPVIDEKTNSIKRQRIEVEKVVEPGGDFREQEFYRLKTEWKIFTTQVIGDLIGTKTLSLNERDLDTPWKNLAPKLDYLNIIYKSKYCENNEDICWAYKQILKNATKTPEIDIYIDDSAIIERFENIRYRLIKIIDCAIANIKLTEAMTRAKMEFVGSPEMPGFTRQHMWEHKQIFDQLKKYERLYMRQVGLPGEAEALKDLEELREQMAKCEGSPLVAFKEFLDYILEKEEGVIKYKIERLNDLKEEIMGSETPMSFTELQSRINSISPEFISQKEERGRGVE